MISSFSMVDRLSVGKGLPKSIAQFILELNSLNENMTFLNLHRITPLPFRRVKYLVQCDGPPAVCPV